MDKTTRAIVISWTWGIAVGVAVFVLNQCT